MPQAVMRHEISVGRLLHRSSRSTEGMRKKQDKRIKAEGFPELKRDMRAQIQSAYSMLNRTNKSKFTPSHAVVKL